MQLRSSQNDSNFIDLNTYSNKNYLGEYQHGLFENRRTISNGFKTDSIKPKLRKIKSASKENNPLLGKKRGRKSKNSISILNEKKHYIMTRRQLRFETTKTGKFFFQLTI